MADYQFDPRYTPDRLDYGVDWSEWLETGESLASVTVSMAVGDLAISDIAHTASSMIFWLTGGSAGYQILTITVTTDHSPPRVRKIQASIVVSS